MGSQLVPVNYLHEGIAAYLGLNQKKTDVANSSSSSLSSETEAASPESRLETLPKYLIVQMMRFSWKASHAAAGTKAGKTKIVRRVVFPKTMDVYDFCSDDLRKKLGNARKEYMNKKLGNTGKKDAPVTQSDSATSDQNNEINNSGFYDLVSVVSHLGRSSEGGHYVCWRKVEGGNKTETSGADSPGQPKAKKPNTEVDDKWVLLDDDEVQETSWKYVADHSGLAGGIADSQIAYLLIFKRAL